MFLSLLGIIKCVITEERDVTRRNSVSYRLNGSLVVIENAGNKGNVID